MRKWNVNHKAKDYKVIKDSQENMGPIVISPSLPQ